MKNTLQIVTLILLLFSSCSSSNDSEEEEILEEVTHEVLLWEFTPDTGNDTQRLRWEIEFHNPNNEAITGFYRITVNADGLVSTLHSTSTAPCYQIEANARCVVSFDEEDSHDVVMANSINLVDVAYIIENQ